VIIRGYILREVSLTLGAVLSVLLLIFFSTRFVSILGDVASGTLPANLVFTLLGLELLKNLATIMPMAIFFSVLLAFGRLYRDNEITVMAATGIGQLDLLRSLRRLAPVLFIITALLALYATPWAAGKSESLRNEAKNRSELSLLAAGRFSESRNGDLIMYVESLSEDQRQLQNVFIQRRGLNSQMVLSSESGYRYVEEESGDEFMVMVDGYRYEGEPGQKNFRITKFHEHAIRIAETEVVPARIRRKSKTSLSLFQSPVLKDTAELQKRLTLPLSAIALMILAVPLSRVNPREGRYGRLFSAVFIYVIYNNIYSAAYNWVGKGDIHPWLGMWWVPLLLVIAAGLIATWQSRDQLAWIINDMLARRKAAKVSGA